jgi:TetR/AcrR family transcriptional repressor of nem operon
MTETTTTREDRSESRDRLVDTAIGLLHDNGYRAVGVQLLCERAGIRKGSFYHFFPSKEELTLAALDQAWDVFRSRVIEPTLEAERDPAARAERIRLACLAPIMHGHDSSPRPHGCLFGRLAASITETEPLLRDRLREIFTEWADLLGGGDEGWASLADIQGRLVLAFTVDDPEVIGA